MVELPPVAFKLYPLPAPTMNLSLRFGILNVDDPLPLPNVVPTMVNKVAKSVLLIAVPSHNIKPSGGDPTAPDQITIPPIGVPPYRLTPEPSSST